MKYKCKFGCLAIKACWSFCAWCGGEIIIAEKAEKVNK